MVLRARREKEESQAQEVSEVKSGLLVLKEKEAEQAGMVKEAYPVHQGQKVSLEPRGSLVYQGTKAREATKAPKAQKETEDKMGWLEKMVLQVCQVFLVKWELEDFQAQEDLQVRHADCTCC